MVREDDRGIGVTVTAGPGFVHGLIRITAAAPIVAVGDPVRCAKHCHEVIAQAADSHLVLLPELALGGYTCGDLFGQRSFLDAVLEAIDWLREAIKKTRQMIVVGAPLMIGDALMNTAVVLCEGRLIGVVPKQYLPNYREFYEQRHYHPGDLRGPTSIELLGCEVPFGVDLLLRWGDAVVGIEICEDLWVPVPPSSMMALAGANVLLNLSASNETVGKAAWRRDLVTSQSGRCIAAYAYASSGPTESSTDLVFGGHCLIAETGRLVGQSQRVGDDTDSQPITATYSVTADIDLQRIEHDRRLTGSWHHGRSIHQPKFRTIEVLTTVREIDAPLNPVDAHPFVPKDPKTLDERCAEISGIQSAALAKRVSRLSSKSPLVIGVSGGLDSTLALLVAVQTCDANGWPRERILGLTMPGFGTTEHTLHSANELMRLLGISAETIDIRPLSLDSFLALQHRPLGLVIDDATTVEALQQQLVNTPHGNGDLVFENVQARLRTFLLMSRGFVLGTGDMSEQALGWCTYNADHMSMYNVNTSIPKTLVRFLVRYAAANHFANQCRDILMRIADTPISPELLPPDASGKIRQSTEAAIGAYELHDFFLFHFIRNGFTREKILYLAKHAVFTEKHSDEQIEKTIDTFFRRFFLNQFKRSCVPDGPKVGSVSLSPRGDWRMPSDADSSAF